MLQFLADTLEEHNAPIPDIPMKLWIDNKTLIKKLTCIQNTSASACLVPDQEVIASICHLMQHFPLLQVGYVKSKQSGPHLAQQAIMHNRSDMLATCARDLCSTYPNSPAHSHSKATLYLHKVEVNDALQTALRHAAYSPNIREYMQTKYKWANRTVDQIDWHVHGRALKGLPPTMKKTITQSIHEWLPTNSHPGRALPEDQQLCPFCESEHESNQHFLECNNPKSVQYWLDVKPQLVAILQKRNTDPVLQDLLLKAILERRTTANPETTTYIPRKYRSLFEDLALIDWHQVVKGRLSLQWVQAQNAFFKNKIYARNRRILGHWCSKKHMDVSLQILETAERNPTRRHPHQSNREETSDIESANSQSVQSQEQSILL